MSKNSDHVGAYLKNQDPDRYFATLVLPEQMRSPVQALYAFNADIAGIAARVSEPAPGEIRLQWWVDLLGGAEHGAVRQNPLAAALLDTIDQFDLPTGPLRRLLAARRFDLYGDPMPDLQTFEGYAGETNSILYQLGTMILNKGNDAGAADAAGHMGVAHALIGHLGALADTAAQGKIFLPWSILQAHGASQGDLFSAQATPGLVQGVAQLREVAAEHLGKAENLVADLPPAIRVIFAPVALLRPQLQRLDKFGDIPFARPPEIAGWQKIARLVWWSMRH